MNVCMFRFLCLLILPRALPCPVQRGSFQAFNTEKYVNIVWFWDLRLSARPVNSQWNVSKRCAHGDFRWHVLSHAPLGTTYQTWSWLEPSLREFPSVPTPEEACVVIAPEGADWQRHENVLLLGANEWSGEHGDRPGTQMDISWRSVGMAHRAHVAEEFQEGVDVQMPAFKEHNIDPATGTFIWLSDNQRARARKKSPRPILVSLRGQVHNWPTPWYPLRQALAMLRAPDIVIELACGNGPYEPNEWGGDKYAELLISSTFAFSTGGGGIDDGRLWEGMAAGAIPVVFDDIILPFHSITPWERCAVRVSSEDVISIPRILRNISRVNVIKRVMACQRIFTTRLESRKALSASLFESVKHQFMQ